MLGEQAGVSASDQDALADRCWANQLYDGPRSAGIIIFWTIFGHCRCPLTPSQCQQSTPSHECLDQETRAGLPHKSHSNGAKRSAQAANGKFKLLLVCNYFHRMKRQCQFG